MENAISYEYVVEEGFCTEVAYASKYKGNLSSIALC